MVRMCYACSSSLLIALLLLTALLCACRCDAAHGISKAHSPTGPLRRGQQSPSITLPTQRAAEPG